MESNGGGCAGNGGKKKKKKKSGLRRGLLFLDWNEAPSFSSLSIAATSRFCMQQRFAARIQMERQ